ncbi:hypothetical protein GCM10010400_39450 [Streptomyces aculeolatus]|uniref:hypothetical protein n=1 Tax=Streptomyces aculeolatus TaxID=270689 RepID=UPI001CED5E46|nr:hypothetical protein [Streptomyces aculeolatus]
MTDLEIHQPDADGTGGRTADSVSKTKADAEADGGDGPGGAREGVRPDAGSAEDSEVAEDAEDAGSVADSETAGEAAEEDEEATAGASEAPASANASASSSVEAAPPPGRRWVLWGAGGITVLVLAADLLTRGFNAFEPIPGVRRMVNVDLEANIATWWNSTLLLAVAGVALAAALLSGRDARPGRLSWLGFSAATALLSVDETVSLHERLGEVGKAWKDTAGVALPSHAWVLPGAILAVAGVVVAVVWARRLPRDLRYGLLGALGVYLGGALVVEAFNGWAHKNDHSLTLMLGTIVEEGLEMGACVVALAVLGRYVVLEHDPVTGRTTAVLRSESAESSGRGGQRSGVTPPVGRAA